VTTRFHERAVDGRKASSNIRLDACTNRTIIGHLNNVENHIAEFPIMGMRHMSPKKIPELPRQTVWMDERGRIVVPEYMRKALGLETPCYVVVERYPAEGECKTLFIKKD